MAKHVHKIVKVKATLEQEPNKEAVMEICTDCIETVSIKIREKKK